MQRLLILACSNRKRHDPGLLPAQDRYDGQAYRVLAGYRRAVRDDKLDLLILSAEFGLIEPETPIPDYDRRMTPARAAELQAAVSAALRERLDRTHYDAVLFFGGADYRAALDDALHADPRLTFTSGGIGAQLSMLKTWLGGPRKALTTTPRFSANVSAPRIRGVTLELTHDEAVNLARQALSEGIGDPDRFDTWYVEIDGRRVAPKWLMCVLSGLPVSAFVTTEARRVLERLGFEVRALLSA